MLWCYAVVQVSVMLWCHDLTKAESRVKVDADKIYLSLGCCSF